MLSDSTSETIRLGTNNGLTGYKIKKFDIVPEAPITSDIEAVMKLEKYEPTTFANTFSFDDPNLLGVAVWWGGAAGVSNPQDWIQIFDNVTFNQDVYISGVFSGGTFNVNYYLELEQVKLSVDEAAVATLKDMRGSV
jgi:hypothetical protein